ncbi:hypothetical protein EXIGLDRAFT_719055 [Exidia glandulosa HHB12029]|uniref:Extracellular membrane protein CFEM domain-containing protein n=1 Tax=Exidia glandulosa HHB12029 TaxID=1314781 RepID=A0A165HCB1_EXIGL|nr:hypothetical protein EXIGLDRAFT_719055 [Exidia glandulosa HHB12029]
MRTSQPPGYARVIVAAFLALSTAIVVAQRGAPCTTDADCHCTGNLRQCHLRLCIAGACDIDCVSPVATCNVRGRETGSTDKLTRRTDVTGGRKDVASQSELK